jgi:hypothetical protein
MVVICGDTVHMHTYACTNVTPTNVTPTSVEIKAKPRTCRERKVVVDADDNNDEVKII